MQFINTEYISVTDKTQLTAKCTCRENAPMYHINTLALYSSASASICYLGYFFLL